MSHLPYIIAAYIVSAVTLGGLAAWVISDLSIQQRKLRKLEEDGLRRRAEVSR